MHDPYEIEPGVQAHFTTHEYSVALSGPMLGFAQPDPPFDGEAFRLSMPDYRDVAPQGQQDSTYLPQPR